jgi:hypothetical protein
MGGTKVVTTRTGDSPQQYSNFIVKLGHILPKNKVGQKFSTTLALVAEIKL